MAHEKYYAVCENKCKVRLDDSNILVSSGGLAFEGKEVLIWSKNTPFLYVDLSVTVTDYYTGGEVKDTYSVTGKSLSDSGPIELYQMIMALHNGVTGEYGEYVPEQYFVTTTGKKGKLIFYEPRLEDNTFGTVSKKCQFTIGVEMIDSISVGESLRIQTIVPVPINATIYEY